MFCPTDPPPGDDAPLMRLLSRRVQRPVEQIRPSMHLEAVLGLDSLGRVELLAALETKLDVFVDESQISGDTTLDQLAPLIAQPREPTQESMTRMPP